ncbi:MAG: hypothetical protein LBQ18_01975, partial [Campylobacteraceae bacterium]|nr:hypothetical protein [Campylobacteraceae bacterium]
MFGFSRKTQTENPSEHLVKLASVSKDTISSKVSVFLKYRFFGLVPIFFAALLFVGCGGSGSSKSDYIVSFYDANLNLIESVGVEKGAVVELSTLAGNNHLLYWYKAGEENATLFGQYTPTGNINFYAVPNVVEVASEDQLYHI